MSSSAGTRKPPGLGLSEWRPTKVCFILPTSWRLLLLLLLEAGITSGCLEAAACSGAFGCFQSLCGFLGQLPSEAFAWSSSLVLCSGYAALLSILVLAGMHPPMMLCDSPDMSFVLPCLSSTVERDPSYRRVSIRVLRSM